MDTSNLFERFNRSASGAPRRTTFREAGRPSEKNTNTSKQDRKLWQCYLNKTFLGKRPLAAILVIVATLLALLGTRSILAVPTHNNHHHHHHHHHHQVSSKPQLRYLQLLIPTTRISDVDLCKTILTAQVLNYPVPVIIPWGNSTNGSPVAKRARMQSKVSHIYKYLKSLPAELDDAITILLDGPDTWFQLRPDQLLHQYFQTLEAANDRSRLGDGQAVEHTLLFAAQSSCVSKNAASLACTVPESPREGGPKYLGNGAIIGQTRHIRAFLKRAYGKVQKEPPNKLLTTYSEIFAQQEHQRKATRPTHPPPRGIKYHFGLSKRLPEPNNTTLTPLPTAHNETYEFGIVLDYNNNVGFTTTSTTPPSAQKFTWQTQHPLTKPILNSSPPPFWTLSGKDPSLPHTSTWSDISLLTLPDTNSIPSMIHHSPTTPNGADTTHIRRDWWPKLWFHKHARALYSNAEQLPATVVAALTREDGTREVYWNRHTWTDKAGAWMGSGEGEFLRWQDMCGSEGVAQRVFGDGGGVWDAEVS